jgi:SOS-response transcriptional repressor LexA
MLDARGDPAEVSVPEHSALRGQFALRVRGDSMRDGLLRGL